MTLQSTAIQNNTAIRQYKSAIRQHNNLIIMMKSNSYHLEEIVD